VHADLLRRRGLQNVASFLDLIGSAMRDQYELARLSGCFIIHDAIFRNARLYSAAPKAVRPPTTKAPSSAPTIQATTEPAATTGPIPGITRKAAPSSRPNSPPQKAPSLPQYFILSPVLLPALQVCDSARSLLKYLEVRVLRRQLVRPAAVGMDSMCDHQKLSDFAWEQARRKTAFLSSLKGIQNQKKLSDFPAVSG